MVVNAVGLGRVEAISHSKYRSRNLKLLTKKYLTTSLCYHQCLPDCLLEATFLPTAPLQVVLSSLKPETANVALSVRIHIKKGRRIQSTMALIRCPSHYLVNRLDWLRLGQSARVKGT